MSLLKNSSIGLSDWVSFALLRLHPPHISPGSLTTFGLTTQPGRVLKCPIELLNFEGHASESDISIAKFVIDVIDVYTDTYDEEA